MTESQHIQTNDRPDITEALREIVANCDRCGSCLTVCPLYSVTQLERSVARGKNSAIKAMLEGGLPINAQLSEMFNYCLLCKACVGNCPSKIKTDEAMMKVREYVTAQVPVSVVHRGLGFFMKNNSLLSLAAAVLGLVKKTKIAALFSPATIPEEFTKAQYQKMFIGPALVPGRPQEDSQAIITGKSNIAYFRGCAMKLFFPEAAADSVRVLAKTGPVAVVDNVCCGMPHKAHGLRDDSVKLAETNIRLFEDYDIVVTDCASCGSALKEYAGYFSPDSELFEKAEEFGKKVRGFSQYLTEVGYVPEYTPAVKLSYHDPCHLVRGQGIKAEPRKLLKQAGEFVESLKADMCCGGAGSFQVDFPEQSKKILADKHNCFMKSGADIIVTECPACMIQLKKAGSGQDGYKVMHISQVV